MAFFSGEHRPRPTVPQADRLVDRVSSREAQRDYREEGKRAGKNEMIKILQPGNQFVAISDVPSDPAKQKEYLSGFWSGMQSKIRECVIDGADGVFTGHVEDWDNVDRMIGERLTVAEINREQGRGSERIDMSDITDLINNLAGLIPPDAMRPTN